MLAIINVGRESETLSVSKKDKKKGAKQYERREERRREARFPSRARAISHSRTHAYGNVMHMRLLVAAHPVAVLTSSARYSVCAIEISFIPDARKVGARN